MSGRLRHLPKLAERRRPDPEFVASLLSAGLTPLAARVLASRGIRTAAELSATDADLPSISGGAAARAAKEIAHAARTGAKVAIIGDYDADGVCGTAIVDIVLEKIGVPRQLFLLSRERYGRGLDADLATQMAASGAKLLLSVDNGTSAHEGVAVARKAGLRTVLTDHHLAAANGPAPADAIANPTLPDSGLPVKQICGAMVALLVMRETVRQLGERMRAESLLDLGALATVADMMPMDELFNRRTVLAGVALIRSGRCCPGIKAMLGAAAGHCKPSDLSHRIGPMVNAAGRVGMPEQALSCLLAKNINDARLAATQLDKLNEKRRRLTTRIMATVAKKMIGPGSYGIVAADRNWALGLLGLVAGRLVQDHGKPTAVLTEHGLGWRGSARGLPGRSVHEALTWIERVDPDMLGSWGGHQTAAGFMLKKEPPEFAAVFDEACAKIRSLGSLEPELYDGEVSASELCVAAASDLARIPWGPRFPEPLFSGNFEVLWSELTASGNGFIHRLRLHDRIFPAWSRFDLPPIERRRRLYYRIAPQRGRDNSAGGSPMLFLEKR